MIELRKMQAMGRLGSLGSYISQGVYTVSGPFHPFGGAVDIVVVEQQDGSFKSSPWYVRFGKFQGVLKAREKVVHITVNGVEADFRMYLDHKGEAFFLREIDADADANDGADADSILMYPSSSGDDTKGHSLRSKSSNFDSGVVGRTSSRRSRILGLVFGRRSLNLKEEVEDADGNRERAEIAANLLEIKWSTNLDGEHNADGLLHQGETLNEEASFGTAQDGKDGAASSDVQVACVEQLEACLEKQLSGEEVSGVSTVDAPGHNIPEEDITQSSKVSMDMVCSTEQAQEMLYLAHGESDEVLHVATALLSEVNS